jgi:hypothetical protein
MRRGVPLLVQSFSLRSNWHNNSYGYVVALFNGDDAVVDVASIPVPINLNGCARREFIFGQLNSYVSANYKEIMLDNNLDRIFECLKRSIDNET